MDQQSPDGVWTKLLPPPLDARSGAQGPAAGYRLETGALIALLGKSPLESEGDLNDSQAELTLPMPDGTYSRFRLQESPIMEPKLADAYPEIKSYRGQGIDDPSATMRCDWSQRGFHAIILSNEYSVLIHPAHWSDISAYASYYFKDSQGMIDGFDCNGAMELPNRTSSPSPANVPVGSIRRTYRIAVATTQEFTNAPGLGGGTVGGTIAAINSLLNAVNAIYDRELSVRMVLVGNNDQVIYTAEPDPFTNGDTIARLNEVRPVLRDRIGTSNYDLGHVLGTVGGGVAYVGVVCDDNTYGGNGPIKGGGTSSVSASGPVTNGTLIMAHELGHMFSAPHSFNASCGGNRSSSSAYESGSGLTIMSYAGGCSPDAIANGTDPRFHAGSFAFISSYISATSGGCAVQTSTGNSIPTVSGGADYAIPVNTPFALTATGNDADAGDVPNLTYVWEQFDSGGSSFPNPPYNDSGDPSNTTRPIFRPFSPTSNPSRTFPSLTYIMNNANDPPDVIGSLQTAEELPRIGRQLNFRVTVRDNRGGVNNDSVLLTVSGGAGPFLVTQPNTSVTWNGGSSQTVTWSVNNTNAAPVNCASVRILLSLDGGNTFPIVLSSGTPNDGSETITVPGNVYSTSARVKVEAAGNVFFDVSNADFTILPPSGCPGVGPLGSTVGNPGASVTLSGINFTGVTSVKFSNNVNASFTVNSNSQITATVPSGAVTGPITIGKPGCPDAVTGDFTICSGPPLTLSVDDGSFETAWGGGPGTASFYVNRLTPGSYPATLSAVIANLNLPAGTNIDIVAGKNTDGDADINGTDFQYTPVPVNSPNQLVTYPVPSLTINSGDFVVGFRYTPATGIYPANFDRTPPSRGRSYYGGPTSFTLFDNLGSNYAGNLGLRAIVYTGNCSSCTYSISPEDQSVPGTGGSGTIDVTASASCGWTAVSNQGWITITSGSSGSGNGTVNFSAASNPVTQPRSGTITVAGQTFTINQSAGCGYTIAPASRNFTAAGGADSVAVTANPGCAWTAVSNTPWIAVTSGNSGSGNGTVNYSVAANAGTSRAGWMTIGGQTFTVIQDGSLAGLQYYPLPYPVRLLDTRPGESACFAPGAPLGASDTRIQQATGTCGGATIPSSAKAVVGNATVVNFISSGYQWITLYPSDAPQPNSSNLNFAANQIVPNQFTVGLGTDGAFKIYSSASTHFIVDVTGYYAPPGAGGLYYHPLPAPIRLFDSRLGETACDAPGAPLENTGARTVLAQRTCSGVTIPSSAKAIAGNATVVNFISTGFNWITLYPFGAAQPNASNLNYTANQIVPNAFVTGLSGDGKFNIYSSGATHFIVDVNGYFSDEAVDVNGTGLLYNPLPAPVRLLDTRPGESGCDAPGAPLGNDATRAQSSHRTCYGVTIPATARAVDGNATVVNFISSGFNWITLYPFGASQPNASNLNFAANQIVPNSFVVGLSSDGRFNIYSKASTHFIVDLTGYFSP